MGKIKTNQKKQMKLAYIAAVLGVAQAV